MPLGPIYRRLLRYPLWRLANLQAPYEEFYAHIVSERIKRRQNHDAIGISARPLRAATELLDIMVKHGMQPHHRFVDYGCGSLRLGKAVIEYLDPDKFYGLDVAQLFLDLGMESLGQTLIDQKRPVLRRIDPSALELVSKTGPDYIGSWHVCSKVPDRHLKRYFSSIIGLMAPQAQAFIQFPQTDRRKRQNHLNWTLSKGEFTEVARSVSPKVRAEFTELIPRNSAGVTETYAHLFYE